MASETVSVSITIKAPARYPRTCANDRTGGYHSPPITWTIC